jgi:oligopeptide/dipeptide ABC transporter ATP-binding protein
MVSDNIYVELRNVTQSFPVKQSGTRRKFFNAVDSVSIKILKGKVCGLVGESGCGKSTLASNILMLQRPDSGHIIYNEEDMMNCSKRSLFTYRRNSQLIFQDPYASMDPRMKIRDIVTEPMHTHRIYKSKKECMAKAEELLSQCGISASALAQYPHEFSGGQRQRIAIARVLAMNPQLIVADESTSALDVSIQAQILNLIKGLQKKYELTLVFVSHDLNVIKHVSDYIAVMYLGRIVEIADKNQIYDNAAHPYTKALISAVPMPDPTMKRDRIRLGGEPADPLNLPEGCALHPRCPHCMEICTKVRPGLREHEGGQVACHMYNAT